MATADRKEKLLRHKTGGEIKRFAPTEDKPIVSIPPVVGPGIVRVEPQVVAIAIQVEHIRVAIGVGNI